MLWELSKPKHAHIQEKLIAEIKSSGITGVPSIRQADSLPYLDAIIKESLRLYTAIPMLFERIVPEGDHILDGYVVPEGSICGAQPYTLHRNPDVYPDPLTFNPDRWLIEKESEQYKRMSQAHFPFLTGSRACIGMHLAMVEIVLILTGIYAKYNTILDPSVSDESMNMDDQVTSAAPVGHSCKIRFVAQ